MNDTITLTNPTTGETWTSGKRGRRPAWVCDMIAAGTVNLPTPLKTEEAPAPKVPGMLRAWKWIGVSGEDGTDNSQCRVRIMIFASDPGHAIRTGSETMQFAISQSEFTGAWKEIPQDDVAVMHNSGFDVTKPACWQFITDKWEIRQPRKVA
jgi:hypothetical protein